MTGFDDDGRPVPTTDPVYPGDGAELVTPDAERTREAIRRFREEVEQRSAGELLDWLATAGSAENIGRRVLALCYLVQTAHSPRTQRELARRMGLSLGRVNAISANEDAAWSDFWHSKGEQPENW